MELNECTARDLMTEGCQCVKEGESIAQAAKMMAELEVGALPICGEDDKLHGMLTDRDIVVKCLAEGKDPSSCTAGDLASGELVWISADAPAADVLRKMEQFQVRRLPVIDADKRLCGIISQGDVAKQLDAEFAGELVEQVSQGPASQEPVGKP